MPGRHNYCTNPAVIHIKQRIKVRSHFLICSNFPNTLPGPFKIRLVPFVRSNFSCLHPHPERTTAESFIHHHSEQSQSWWWKRERLKVLPSLRPSYSEMKSNELDLNLTAAHYLWCWKPDNVWNTPGKPVNVIVLWICQVALSVFYWVESRNVQQMAKRIIFWFTAEPLERETATQKCV